MKTSPDSAAGMLKRNKSWPLSRQEDQNNQPKLTERQRMDAAYWFGFGGVPAEWIARDLGVHRSVVIRWTMKLKTKLPEGYVPALPEPQMPKGLRGDALKHQLRSLKSWETRKQTGVKRSDASTYDTTSQVPVPDETVARTPTPIPVTDEERLAARARLAAGLTLPMGIRAAVTLTVQKAGIHATQLERNGWRAEPVSTSTGYAYVEVRDLAVRIHPVIARLRTPEDVKDWHIAHPEHGLIDRVPTAPEHIRATHTHRRPSRGMYPPLASLQAMTGKWRTHDADY